MRLSHLAFGAMSLIAGTALIAQPPALKPLRLICIPSLPLPVAVAQSHGFFVRQGLDVHANVVHSSAVLRESLAGGKADIAFAAVDNAVAMNGPGKPGVVIVLGGERSLNELIAQPGIHSISDLRGKTLIVDAPTTAFALQMIEMLRKAGLHKNDYTLKVAGTTPFRLKAMEATKSYAATMLGPPWSIEARRAGFVSLGSTSKRMGPYQALGSFTRRAWAEQNADTIERYIAAYVEAQRWLLDPAHEAQVVRLLVEHFHLTTTVANETYALLSAPNNEWYEKDARCDPEGFKTVLRLRAEIEGQWGGVPPAVDTYYDATYYDRALQMLKKAK
ncbi:MAG: ABC transporter substrate-binding protein [Acidobacteriota bacterium]|nr:ABC transporter substrate-binding protein [Acidobacteriota bacterium]